MTSQRTAAAPICSATIVAATRRIVEVRERARAAGRAGERARRRERAAAPGAFEAALRRGRTASNVIAECKRRSPSRGVLRADYDPVGDRDGLRSRRARRRSRC